MAGAVYVLTTLISGACAVLLLRSYARSHARLLLWSGCCFIGLTVDNAMHFADAIVFPDASLAVWRGLPSLIGLGVMLCGFVWERR